MNFNNILEHEEIKKRLINSIETNTVSHAYIFSGNNGIGKTAMAMEFAKILTNNSMEDITVVTNEYYNLQKKKKTTNLSVETIREARVDMFKKPYNAPKRVFIIPNSETLISYAQNALLKIFEEPPEYIVIILITENEKMLLQTIRSRAVTYYFRPLSDATVLKYINENCSASANKEDFDLITTISNGSIGKAVSFCENEDLFKVCIDFCSMFTQIKSQGYGNVYRLIQFLEGNKDNFSVIGEIILILIHKNLLQNNQINDKILMQGFSITSLANSLKITEQCISAIKLSGNYKVVVSELVLGIKES